MTGEVVLEGSEARRARELVIRRLAATRNGRRAGALLVEALDSIADSPQDLLRLCARLGLLQVELRSCRSEDRAIGTAAAELLHFGARIRRARLDTGAQNGRPPLPISTDDARTLRRDFGSVAAASAASGVSASTLRRRARGEGAHHD